MFQYLPVEIIQAILADVTDLHDLASLSRVSRLLNAQTTPLLYRHTVLDIRTATYSPYATGYTERWRAQLHGLALNTRNQCQNITTLIVKNSHPQNNPDILWRNGRMPPDDGQSLSHAEKKPFLSLVCSMVEIALRHMPRLDTFTWAVDICATSSILASLSEKPLTSLTFFHCDQMCQTITNEWPFRPDLSILCNSSLASLCIMNIACDKAADDLASLIFSHRHSLGSLSFGFRTWDWQRSLDIEPGSLPDEEHYAYMDSWANDQLLPILRDIVEAGNPLNLHTLEIHRVDSINVPRLIQAFCFQTVQRFALIDTYFGHLNEQTEELWRSLKDQRVSFQYLVTDAPTEELVDFVGSFQGLEGFLLCDYDALVNYAIPEPHGWMGPLSGHFSTLRHLLIPMNVLGSHFFAATDIQAIVDGCPNLEEFGWGTREEDLNDILRILSGSSTLRSIYILTCRKRGSILELRKKDGPSFCQLSFFTTL